MIIALSIRDFVITRRLDIEPSNGFTALTGETGAGKSIILDALSTALGGQAEKRFVRAGAKQASVSVEFALAEMHPVRELLAKHGVFFEPDETLTCRRIIPAKGPSRGFINDQPASAALLAEIGESLVEIHGQHAASMLLKPLRHRQCIDLYAGCEVLLKACTIAWQTLGLARALRAELEQETRISGEEEGWLLQSVEDLAALSPEPGEAGLLVSERVALLQSGRITEAASEAQGLLLGADIETVVIGATRAIERVIRLPGLEDSGGPVAMAARLAGEALERALIEIGEADDQLARLGGSVDHDGDTLERIEQRLFALRAQARKHDVEADALPDLLAMLQQRLAAAQVAEAALKTARKAEIAAAAQWHTAAGRLSAARKAAAGRFDKVVAREFKPLKLTGMRLRVAITPLPDAKCGPGGIDQVEFEVETNPGGGFGPLRKIASGGELARFSLALKCALAEAGGAETLIFDEADQGVGGAVAAAIGERLDHLSQTRQVFAITHSPQVAASGARQWLVEKRASKTGLGETRIRSLDVTARTEEIARMLSGAKITVEARAAATRLLEGP